jgi:hypothetical protein
MLDCSEIPSIFCAAGSNVFAEGSRVSGRLVTGRFDCHRRSANPVYNNARLILLDEKDVIAVTWQCSRIGAREIKIYPLVHLRFCRARSPV